MRIEVKCKAQTEVPLDDLVELQGNLAELSKENYRKLRNSIEKNGITFAMHVWQDNGKTYIVDGHARYRTLRLMADEGADIPPIPVVIVEAKDMKEAKRRVLLGRSDYHEVTSDGLYEFLSTAQIEFDDVQDEINFSSIDVKKFIDEFGDDVEEKDCSDQCAVVHVDVSIPSDIWLEKNSEIVLALDNIANTYGSKYELV